jgi:antitoxin component YwqK of YwqJK toxin-antitoxin module
VSEAKGIDIIMKGIKENDKKFIFKDIIQMYDLDFEEMTVGFHKGIPFTGFAFSMHPVNGELQLLATFKEGFEEGIYREWHENGQLKEVREMTQGQSDGYKICWYPNGLLKSQCQYMEGITIYEKSLDEKSNMIEDKIFLKNLNGYLTRYKNGTTRYQKDPWIYNKCKKDKFTYGLYKLLTREGNDSNINLNLQNYEQDYLQDKGQEILKYIESNINVIYERENLYKHAVKKEMLQIEGNKTLYSGELFTGLSYDMPFIEEVGSYVLFSIYAYKNGCMHGRCLEWYSDGLVEPKKIIEEGCSDEGEYWYSKGSLKKYAHYELGKELDYREWDEKGNLIKERINS